MEEYAVSIVDRCVDDLKIDRRDSTAATPGQVREAITLLLDDEHYHSADVRCWFSVRADRFALARRNDFLVTADERAVGPMHYIDLSRMIQEIGAEARASTAWNWPTASTSMPPNFDVEGPRLYLETRPGTRIIGYPTMSVEGLYRHTNKRRAAAVALAICLYRHDHGGAFPRAIEDLVSAYLPAVPRDAMAAGNHPLCYRPNPPAILSVTASAPNPDSRPQLSTAISKKFDVICSLEPPPWPQSLKRGSAPAGK
jgi:hypothetical protein